METPHSDFSEVARVVFIKVGSVIIVWERRTTGLKIGIPVVVLTTSKTTTSRMLAVLAYSTMTGRNVAAVFSCL